MADQNKIEPLTVVRAKQILNNLLTAQQDPKQTITSIYRELTDRDPELAAKITKVTKEALDHNPGINPNSERAFRINVMQEGVEMWIKNQEQNQAVQHQYAPSDEVQR